jgi:CDI immunity proteins
VVESSPKLLNIEFGGGGLTVVDGVVWPEKTLTQLEGEDWGEPNYPSYVVTNCHRLRNKSLREFAPEDLRFMVGQQISLPILMPMALDVLELVVPFVGGDMNHGTLLYNALKVNKKFWQDHPQLWYRMNVVLVDLYSFREFIEQELVPAAEAFKTAGPR